MGKIIHIVLWKLKPQASDAELKKVQDEIKNLLKVPGPISMHIGPPEIAQRAQGWDWGLYSVFEDRKALDTYAVSDAHVDTVKDHVRPYWDDCMAYDWELTETSGY